MINVNGDDWILSAQLQYERLKYIQVMLSQTPQCHDKSTILLL